jgi:hypothetical protein
VYIDNAPVHNSLKRLSHPSYFLDIPPSDIYVIAKVKSALTGPEIPDEIDLLEEVTETLNGISGAELQRVFQSWIERVEKVIDAGGDH